MQLSEINPCTFTCISDVCTAHMYECDVQFTYFNEKVCSELLRIINSFCCESEFESESKFDSEYEYEYEYEPMSVL